jgi:hypothetical protein
MGGAAVTARQAKNVQGTQINTGKNTYHRLQGATRRSDSESAIRGLLAMASACVVRTGPSTTGEELRRKNGICRKKAEEGSNALLFGPWPCGLEPPGEREERRANGGRASSRASRRGRSSGKTSRER